MFKYLMMVVTAMLFGCTTNTHNQTESLNGDDFESMKQEMVNDLVAAKLRENGARLLCGQENYRSCFRLSYQGCLSQAQPHNEECYQRAMDKVQKITSNDDAGKLFAFHFMCIATKNLVQSPNIQESAECLRDVKFDNEKALRTLFQSSSSI